MSGEQAIFLMIRITVLPMVGAGHGEMILRYFAAHSQQSLGCSTNASIDLQDDNVIYVWCDLNTLMVCLVSPSSFYLLLESFEESYGIF